MDTIEVESCIQGHHVYSSIWTPVLLELLTCQREMDNAEDQYAVVVRKGEDIVGHVPMKILFLCSIFIRRGGVMHCIINANRCYSHDLPQGGMEVPCKLMFSGAEKDLDKVMKYLEDCGMQVVARPSTYIRNVENDDTSNVNVKQELLSSNFASSSVCIPKSSSTASIIIKEEEGYPPTKYMRLDCDDSKSTIQ